MKIIDLKNSTIHLRTDGIMHVHIKEGADMLLQDAVLVVEAIGEIGNSKKFPVYIDCGDYAFIDKEVRTFSASKEANIYTLADAIAYHSLAQKLVDDFYLKQNRPEIPTKIFSEKEKAITWLKTFLKETKQEETPKFC